MASYSDELCKKTSKAVRAHHWQGGPLGLAAGAGRSSRSYLRDEERAHARNDFFGVQTPTMLLFMEERSGLLEKTP